MEPGIAMTTATAAALPNERSLLIVEDDKSFLHRLARAMEGRGFVVTTAESVADGLLQVEKAAPAFAVVDMRLGDGNGLGVLSGVKNNRARTGDGGSRSPPPPLRWSICGSATATASTSFRR